MLPVRQHLRVHQAQLDFVSSTLHHVFLVSFQYLPGVFLPALTFNHLADESLCISDPMVQSLAPMERHGMRRVTCQRLSTILCVYCNRVQ